MTTYIPVLVHGNALLSLKLKFYVSKKGFFNEKLAMGGTLLTNVEQWVVCCSFTFGGWLNGKTPYLVGDIP